MRNPDPETDPAETAHPQRGEVPSPAPAEPAPRHPPPSARADARRNHDAVVAAAIRLLADDLDASMTAIADASGVTRTTVYRHFPTRDALLRAVLTQIHGEFIALGAAIVGAGAPLPETLRRFAREIVAHSTRYRFLSGFRALVEEVVEDEQLIEDDAVLAWLRAAHARGELRPETPPEWQFRMLRALVTAACEEVAAGRLDADQAGARLGETLVAALVAQRSN